MLAQIRTLRPDLGQHPARPVLYTPEPMKVPSSARRYFARPLDGRSRLTLPRLPQQRGTSSAARARLQPGQLPAHARFARRSGPLVADHLTREADQDRRQGRPPRSQYHVPPWPRAPSREACSPTSCAGLTACDRSDPKRRFRGPLCRGGASENEDSTNHLHVHHQCDNTQGEQRLVQDGAEEDDKHPHVPAQPKV